MTTIERSEGYESRALDWLYAQVERLRESLAASGVSDEAVQRAVCEAFFFGLAVEFDDGEVVASPRARRRLAFEEGDSLLLPDDAIFDFHDYVHGVVGEAFRDA